jgi:hypothetical protein
LVVFLILTKGRTRHNPRYSASYIDEELLLGETPRAGANKALWESTNLDLKNLGGGTIL